MKKVTLLLVGLLLIWSAPAAAVPFMVGNTQTLKDAGYEMPWAMKDKQDQVETVVDLWNGDLANTQIPLPAPIDLTPGSEYEELNGKTNLKQGSYLIPEGITYVSFKYARQFELWYVDGDAGKTVEFGPWRNALSHYDEWGGGSPVPEPATMFLFGSGLAGLAALRKKNKK